jgi:hypothetical protein
MPYVAKGKHNTSHSNLVADIDRVVAKRAPSRELVVDLLVVIERHFAHLSRAVDEDLSAMGRKLDTIVRLLKK